MQEVNTQKVLDNVLKNLWKSDKDAIQQDWKTLREYNPCK